VKTNRGSTDIDPFIPNLSTRWSCVINFTPQPFYSQEETPLYRRFGRLQSVTGHFGEEKNFIPGHIQTADVLAYSLVTTPTTLL
jgi:hypothetical protein